MRKILLYMNMTLDGFLAGPHNELDWFNPGDDEEMTKDIMDLLKSVDTGLMGFPTAPGMIEYWSNVKEKNKDPQWMLDIAEEMTRAHIIVISNKEEKLEMKNAELVVAKNDEELVSAINKIKNQKGGPIYLPGGVRTAQNFSRLGLVDEYMLMIHPVAIGEGKPLFISRINLKLDLSKSYKNGVVQLRLKPAKDGK